jgi:hypothetical protein
MKFDTHKDIYDVITNMKLQMQYLHGLGLNYSTFAKSDLQKEILLDIITHILIDPRIREIERSGKGQVWYLLANAVASYASYNHLYWLSTEAMSLLRQENIDYKKPLTRYSLFNIRDAGVKRGAKKLTFEHMCPATHLIDEILNEISLQDSGNYQNQSTYTGAKEIVSSLLDSYSVVAVITKLEDGRIPKEYRSKLGGDIDTPPLDRMINRYNASGICLEQTLLVVYGKMYR